MKSVLGSAVKTFYDAVGLGMKCGGVVVGNVVEGGKVLPAEGNELRAAVRGDSVQKAKVGNPHVEQRASLQEAEKVKGTVA